MRYSIKYTSFPHKKANSGDGSCIRPLNTTAVYLCAGFSGAGASAGFSGAGAGAGASAGFSGAGAGAGASAGGFGVSAGLQPTVKATNNIKDNTNAIIFFITFSPPSTCRFLKKAHQAFIVSAKINAIL